MKQRRFTAMLLAGVMCLTSVFTGMTTVNAAETTKASEQKQTQTGDLSVQQILDNMTVRQKITQMMMPDFRYWDEDLTDDKGNVGVTELNSQIQKIVEGYDFGGVILFAQNVTGTEQTLNLTKQYQAAATKDGGIPLLIGIDQEGGSVYRLGTGTALPGNMAVGATKNEDYAKINGEIIGRELSSLGINCDFAPVADVNNNPNNPVIGLRSFSDDPQTVAKMSVAMIEGLNNYNVASAAKHFLGHGDTGTDSHTGLPVVDKSREELEQNELVPFRAAMEAGADMFMTAHIAYPQIDDTKVVSQKTGEEVNLPATLSKKILTDLVRNEMGYDGILITDAMNMAGLSGNFGQVEASIRAIQAGIDILLMPCVLYNLDNVKSLDAIIEGIEGAIADGNITEARLDESCERILKLKEKRGILDYDGSKLTVENAKQQVGSAQNRDLERKLSAAAVTVIKNENNVLPLDVKEDSKVLFLTPYANELPCVAMGWTRAKEAGLIPDGAECKTIRFSSSSNLNTAEVKEALEWADTVFVNSEVSSPARMQPNYWLTKFPTNVADYCRENNKKSIILSVDKPYDVQHYANADAILAVYGCKGSSADPTEILNQGVTSTEVASGPNITAGVEVAFGVFAAGGRLPVNIYEFDEANSTYTDKIVYKRGYGITYASRAAKKMIKDMTLRQKITQMMMPDFRYWDEDLTDSQGNVGVTSVNSQIAKVVEDYDFGGVILFAQNVTETVQTLRLTRQYQAAATKDGGIPLLIGIDQEGGSVYRLGTGTALPGNMAVGATGSESYAKQNGEIVGRELSSLGINCDFAPVMDVNNNPNNPVIGLRSFSDDPQLTAKMGVAMIQGLNKYNVASAAKHFLGHGDTATDSHTGLPVVNKSREQLEQTELVPFRAAIDAGVDMFMTAHIVYPQIDDTTVISQKTGAEVNLPATLSKKVLTNLVREEMGYDGILITDAMNMAGISENFGQVEASIRAIQAGIDILLMPCVLYNLENVKDLDAIIEGIEKAVESGDITEERLEESCERILALKERRGILEYNSEELSEENALQQVGSAQNRAIEREMSAAAVTVIKNEDNVLPLNIKPDSHVLFIAPYDNEPALAAMAWNRAKEARLIPETAEFKTIVFDWTMFDESVETKQIKEALEWADTVLINSEVSSAYNMQSWRWPTKLTDDAVKYCKANDKTCVVLSVDKPYDVQHYADAHAILAVYGCMGSSADPTEILTGGATSTTQAFGPNITAGVEVALGTFGASGKLPVNINQYYENSSSDYGYTSEIVYPRGYGLTYDRIDVCGRVNGLIARIGTIELTEECGDIIESAMAYYNVLTAEEKAQIADYEKLLTAVSEYNALKTEDLKNATEGLKNEAEAAAAAAAAAQDEAMAAQIGAEAAQAAAEEKATEAGLAKTEAETAAAAAATAQSDAEAAAAAAAEAAREAKEAEENISGTIADTLELLQAKADTAQAAADAAQNKADAAQVSAEAAAEKATAAESAASAALDHANAAAAKADAADASAKTAERYANEVKEAWDAAKEAIKADAEAAASAVKAAQDKVDAARKIADDAQKEITALVTTANNAMAEAQRAQIAAEKARSEAEAAQKLADQAERAAEKAQLAAEKAQAAAENEVEKAKLQVEAAKNEAEKAKVEVENAKAEVERAKAEVQNAKAEVEKAKAEAEKARQEAQKAVDAAATAQKLLEDYKKEIASESQLWMGILEEIMNSVQEPTVITTNKAKYSVKAGKTVQIKASASDGSKLTYKSSNKKIAKVTAKGKIKGIKKGKATITIKANGVQKKVKVTVK